MEESARLAMVDLGVHLRSIGYRFVTTTPESHRRVLGRTTDVLRRLLGWSQTVAAEDVDEPVVDLLSRAGALVREPGNESLVRSLVRFSTLDDLIFVHSAYPTSHSDAVFFGPDSYRFVRFLRSLGAAPRAIVDLCCGSGVGGIAASAWAEANGNAAPLVYLTDINPLALDYARVNASINASINSSGEPHRIKALKSDLLQDVPGGVDLIIANPPFLMDDALRAYRHGGEFLGSELSIKIVRSALNYLQPGGQLALYTGACIVDGEDVFFRQIHPLLRSVRVSGRPNCEFNYEELDPDIFGEELGEPPYSNVERIAAVSLKVTINPAD